MPRQLGKAIERKFHPKVSLLPPSFPLFPGLFSRRLARNAPPSPIVFRSVARREELRPACVFVYRLGQELKSERKRRGKIRLEPPSAAAAAAARSKSVKGSFTPPLFLCTSCAHAQSEGIIEEVPKKKCSHPGLTLAVRRVLAVSGGLF